MSEKNNVFEKLSTKNKIKYPLAVLGSALAGLAFTGCYRDETIDFGVICGDEKELKILRINQPDPGNDGNDSGSLRIACEDAPGSTSAVDSVWFGDLNDKNKALANNALSIDVTVAEDLAHNRELDVSFDNSLSPDFTKIDLDYIHSIESTELTPVK